MSDYRKELETAERLAKEAGEIILKYFRKPFKVHNKADLSPVTEADLAASRFLVERLNRAFPNDVIISEEHIPKGATNSKRIWFVDPLDGTKEFIEGNDEFAVLIALLVGGSPMLGALYMPAKGEFAYAVEGGGAFLIDSSGKGSRLKVSSRQRQSELVIVHSRHHDVEALRLFRESFAHGKSYPCGSAAMKCLEVAKGRADLYPHPYKGLKAWDTAATYVIVREAGGVYSDGEGGRLLWSEDALYHKKGVIAGSPFAHKLALMFLRGEPLNWEE
ncbi:MAG: 3'(2'),5'-bisphosphate nucleotidase CysQ [Myxococcota bacterium]